MECGVTHRAFVGASYCEGPVGHSVGFCPEPVGEPGCVCHVVVCRPVYQEDEDPIGSLCSLGGPCLYESSTSPSTLAALVGAAAKVELWGLLLWDRRKAPIMSWWAFPAW